MRAVISASETATLTLPSEEIWRMLPGSLESSPESTYMEGSAALSPCKRSSPPPPERSSSPIPPTSTSSPSVPTRTSSSGSETTITGTARSTGTEVAVVRAPVSGSVSVVVALTCRVKSVPASCGGVTVRPSNWPGVRV